MNRTSLPREFTHTTGERRRMVNPALGTYARGPLVMPTICCVSGCGHAATNGAWCRGCFLQYAALNEEWEREAVKLASEEHQARKARLWRFVNGFLFFACFELLVGYCIDSPRIWQSFALVLGCAFVIALGNALLGGARMKKAGGN